ncbi:hypothetical protein ACFWM1_07020 [Nocardia sp. NPDC058379]|uniref:hypothetical protein n=1 Tax=unclassified Nocardia TaxID=2637762 RepID=UPI0036566B61
MPKNAAVQVSADLGAATEPSTVLFIHGTGVRQPSYDARLGEVTAAIGRIRPTWRVAPCYWAGEHGSTLHAGGASLPGAADRPGYREHDPELALWWALDHDPLAELRAVADRHRSLPSNPFRGEHGGDDLRELAESIPSPELVAVADRHGLAPALREGLSTVRDAPEFEVFVDPPDAPEYIDPAPLARAIVAATLNSATRTSGFGFPGPVRDELLEAVQDDLGGATLGIAASAGRALVELAMRAGGSRWVDRKRAGWTNDAAPATGDVLRYLARGEGIREYIAQQVGGVTGPVVLLAHSLGGIAALELLAARPLPQVTHLITVGSQAPFLYELDALPTLPYPLPLPASVPRWTNIYDPRDLLGYRGSELFGARVRDIEVDNRAPFPTAHSAYFFRGNTGFYDVLDDVLR